MVIIISCAVFFFNLIVLLQEKFKDLNVFQYGITPGSWEYREQLAKFLTDSYGVEVQRCAWFVLFMIHPAALRDN